MPEFLVDAWNVLLVTIGFSLVIFVHELGHFLAARWAGIRVHAFSIGFGRAIVSYRRGLGYQMGSSDREYAGLLADQGLTPSRGHLEGVSDTEYRINWIPFGGYVRMLGQEDANPNANSDAPDSYTQKPVWKRMIVISGGVVMNVVLAAVLFMIVFLVGMKEVPASVGSVMPGSPAAKAGFESGDAIIRINGHSAQAFSDLVIASAMSGPEESVEMEVQRGEHRLDLVATPTRDEGEVLKTIGIAPPSSLRLNEVKRDVPRDELLRDFHDAGLRGVEPGMRVVAINGDPVDGAVSGSGRPPTLERVRRAAHVSEGRPIALAFADAATGKTVETSITPDPELNVYTTRLSGEKFLVDHLLGLVPLMQVQSTRPRGEKQGLRAGDVFLRVGDVGFPSTPEAISAVRSRRGKSISLLLLRDAKAVEINARVGKDGLIGFTFTNAMTTPVVAKPPRRADGAPPDNAASRIEPPLDPGSLIVGVDGTSVSSLLEVRTRLQEITRGAAESGAALTISIAAIPPGEDAGPPTLHSWTLGKAEVQSLQSLGWTISPSLEAQFQVATITLRAKNPLEAMVMGVRKTNRIMMLTYLTFQRLAQGTVSATELRGPVGIAQAGSQYASEGFIYLVFFLALISANLAVINFLPIPIVDGGLFVMLLYEGITRRPVPIIVQNVATAVGLALIITAFIFVTFNDIQRLF